MSKQNSPRSWPIINAWSIPFSKSQEVDQYMYFTKKSIDFSPLSQLCSRMLFVVFIEMLLMNSLQPGFNV